MFSILQRQNIYTICELIFSPELNFESFISELRVHASSISFCPENASSIPGFVLLAFLACVDFLALFLRLLGAMSGRLLPVNQHTNVYLCKIYHILFLTLGIASGFTIVAMSIERMLAFFMPVMYKQRASAKVGDVVSNVLYNFTFFEFLCFP